MKEISTKELLNEVLRRYCKAQSIGTVKPASLDRSNPGCPDRTDILFTSETGKKLTYRVNLHEIYETLNRGGALPSTALTGTMPIINVK